ncbi:MAG: hypothetical protein Q9159_006074 [Coniocarpon cinnabarinum]
MSATPPTSLPYPAPAHKARKILPIEVVFAVLATFAVALRLLGRRLKRTSILIEDWVVLFGLICQYGYTATNLAAVYQGGVGYHIEEVPDANRTLNLRLSLALQVLYAVAMGCMKCSICITFARVFFPLPFRIITFIVMGICIAWAISVILVTFLICTPLSYNWNTTTQTGHCGNTHAGYVSIGAVDVITDGLILFLPIPMVLRLQMRTVQKLGVLSIFSLGVLATVIGILRLDALVNTDFSDFTYTSVDVYIWGPLEPCVALIVACGVTLKPILDHTRAFASKLSSGRTRASSNNALDSDRRTDREGGYRNSQFYRLEESRSEDDRDGIPLVDRTDLSQKSKGSGNGLSSTTSTYIKDTS